MQPFGFQQTGGMLQGQGQPSLGSRDLDSFLDKLGALEKVTLDKAEELELASQQIKELLELKRTEADKLAHSQAKTMRLQKEIADLRVEHLDAKRHIDVIDDYVAACLGAEDAAFEQQQQDRKNARIEADQQAIQRHHEWHLQEIAAFFDAKPDAQLLKKVKADIESFNIEAQTAQAMRERQALVTQLRELKKSDKDLSAVITGLSTERDELHRKLKESGAAAQQLQKRAAEQRSAERGEQQRLERELQQLKAQATQAQRRQEALQRQLEAARSGAGFASASSVLGNQDRAAALPSQSSQGSYARGSSGSSGGADSSDNRPRGKLIGGPGYSGGRGAGSGSASGRAGGGIPEAAAAGMDEDDGEYAGVVFGGRGSSSSGQGSGSGSGSGSRAGSSGRAGQVAAAKPSRSRLIALDDDPSSAPASSSARSSRGTSTPKADVSPASAPKGWPTPRSQQSQQHAQQQSAGAGAGAKAGSGMDEDGDTAMYW